MKKQIIKVGFDLDGVLLYNPTRIARPIIVFIKKIFFTDQIDKFHYPKTAIQHIIWSLLHKSSMFVSPSYEEIKNLIKNKQIEAYIISARYEFLKSDFDKWINIMKAKKYFKKFYINKNGKQPYIFKREIISRLKLDIYIEDNWDIVRQITKTQSKTKVFWISNYFDINIKYNFKFRNLKKAVEALKKLA